MQYYDQHVHTNFSFDAREDLRSYVALAKDCVITTEHLDLNNPSQDFKDSMPDDAGYERLRHEIAKETNVRLLKGIEVGYRPDLQERILSFLANKHYDLVLLSIHQNGRYDYMDEEARQYPIEEVLHEYFSAMCQGVKEFPCANVVAHFDYVARIQKIEKETFLKIAIPYLKEIFPVMIEKQMALELNTRSMFQYGQLALYEEIVPLYQHMGGKLFTLSSDAHKAESYEYAFDQGKAFLQRHGIKELVVYQQQKPVLLTGKDIA